MKSARREISITTDTIVGFPGETEEDFEETLSLLDAAEYDAVFAFKYSPRPNTPAIALEDAIPEEEKTRRLAILNEKQREIQRERYKRHIGQTIEAMVEGKNDARGQWIGRTSQNKTLNFTAAEGQDVQRGKLRASAGNHEFSQQPGGRNGGISGEKLLIIGFLIA